MLLGYPLCVGFGLVVSAVLRVRLLGFISFFCWLCVPAYIPWL